MARFLWSSAKKWKRSCYKTHYLKVVGILELVWDKNELRKFTKIEANICVLVLYTLWSINCPYIQERPWVSIAVRHVNNTTTGQGMGTVGPKTDPMFDYFVKINFEPLVQS